MTCARFYFLLNEKANFNLFNPDSYQDSFKIILNPF